MFLNHFCFYTQKVHLQRTQMSCVVGLKLASLSARILGSCYDFRRGGGC